MQIYSDRIETILAEMKKTQSWLSETSGISRQSICTILKRGTCTPKSAGKLADGLGVPVSEIVGREVVR